jgi:hypothetical protein
LRFFDAIRFRVKYYWPTKGVTGREAIGYRGPSRVSSYPAKEKNRYVADESTVRSTACRHQKGSLAAELYKKAGGLHPDALAPGLTPSPEQDLKFRGGKTIQDLNFINFYVAGQSAWDANEIQKIDTALSAAMSDTDLNNVNDAILRQPADYQHLCGLAPTGGRCAGSCFARRCRSFGCQPQR